MSSPSLRGARPRFPPRRPRRPLLGHLRASPAGVVADRTDLGPARHRLAPDGRRRRRPARRARCSAGGGHPRPPRRPARARSGCVLVGAGLAVYQSAYFAAVATAGVSIATLVALGLAPLLVAVGAAVLGHGRPDRATRLGAGRSRWPGWSCWSASRPGPTTGTRCCSARCSAVGSALGYADA